MRIALVLLVSLVVLPAVAQEQKNPSILTDSVEIPAGEFNVVARNAAIMPFENTHGIGWQITINNDLLYANPLGNAVVRFYDTQDQEKFIEIGMGGPPEDRFWVAVQVPDNEGYVVVHNDPGGWAPSNRILVSFGELAGFSVNNGVRIVVSNLDIGSFTLGSYSVHGMQGSTDPPAVHSGTMTIELLSGDPTKNVFALFPFYITAGVGAMVGLLYITKKRSS